MHLEFVRVRIARTRLQTRFLSFPGMPWWSSHSCDDRMSLHFTKMCVQYIGGSSVHRGDIMSTSGNVQCIGGLNKYIRRISSVHQGIS